MAVVGAHMPLAPGRADFRERPGLTQCCRLLPGVVGHGQAFRDIDKVFSVDGLNLASLWRIFG
jgi:hypothetical protein